MPSAAAGRRTGFAADLGTEFGEPLDGIGIEAITTVTVDRAANDACLFEHAQMFGDG